MSHLDDYDILQISNLRNPLVSVIVPVFNQMDDGKLTTCVDSILNQDLEGIELILVDDASADGSRKELLKYADENENITLVFMKSNKRQGAARNRGIAIARGKFIGFVDSDDAISANYYSSLVSHAVKTDADVVAATLIRTDNLLTPLGEKIIPYQAAQCGVVTDETRKKIICNHSYIVVHLFCAHVVKDSYFPENVSFEDNPTALRWIYSYRHLEQIQDACYYYRKNPNSTSSVRSVSQKKIEDRIQTSNLMLKDAKAVGVYDRYKDEIEYCYIQTLLITGIRSLAAGHKLNSKLIEGILNSLKQNIPTFERNKYLAHCQTPDRAIVLLSKYCPSLIPFFGTSAAVFIEIIAKSKRVASRKITEECKF